LIQYFLFSLYSWRYRWNRNWWRWDLNSIITNKHHSHIVNHFEWKQKFERWTHRKKK